MCACVLNNSEWKQYPKATFIFNFLGCPDRTLDIVALDLGSLLTLKSSHLEVILFYKSCHITTHTHILTSIIGSCLDCEYPVY